MFHFRKSTNSEVPERKTAVTVRNVCRTKINISPSKCGLMIGLVMSGCPGETLGGYLCSVGVNVYNIWMGVSRASNICDLSEN